MLSLVLSVVLLALSLGNSGSYASQIDDRIRGGEKISDDERYTIFYVGPSFFCFVTKLSEQWVITTSYCINANKVRPGEIFLEELGTVADITLHYDLALIKLTNPGPYFHRMKSVALPDLDEDLNLSNNTEATIFGLYMEVIQSAEIHKMNVTLKTGDDCKKFYQSPYAKEYYTCMEITEEKTTCAYDEGALMVVNGKLAALATISTEITTCPSAATYQLFVKISAFRAWIHDVTNL
ncbi:trypsin-5 [Anabrus simplex]|uniref:trypsin-5 n=1 Tax=Anabrus simplex TaxID=316456 RepID=UPI0035A27A35